MVNINLADDAYQKDNKTSIYNKGALILALVLIFLIAGYLAIYFMQKNVIGKISDANKLYGQEHDKLLSGRNKEIVDFQNRMTVAKGLVNKKNSGLEGLPAMEKTILPGVFLNSFDFKEEGSALEIQGVADNFEVLAKQIASFKNSSYFSGVDVGKTALDESGKVSFYLNLNIK